VNAIVRVLLWAVCFPIAYTGCVVLFSSLIHLLTFSPRAGRSSIAWAFFWTMMTLGGLFWLIGFIPVAHQGLRMRWLSGWFGRDYWLCQSCGYNMRTVPRPICPEYGTEHAIKRQKDR